MPSRYSSSESEEESRPRPSSRPRTRKSRPYQYRKLLDIFQECTDNARIKDGFLRDVITIPTDCFAYLAVAEVLEPDYPNSYKLLVADDTMENILLRIHDVRGESAGKFLGPKPYPGQIIRIHRATAQMESKNRSNSDMVLSIASHHNYTLMKVLNNGKICYQTIAKNISEELSDVEKIKTIWDLILRKTRVEQIAEEQNESESEISTISDSQIETLSEDSTSENLEIPKEQEIAPNNSEHVEYLDSESEHNQSYEISEQEDEVENTDSDVVGAKTELKANIKSPELKQANDEIERNCSDHDEMNEDQVESNSDDEPEGNLSEHEETNEDPIETHSQSDTEPEGNISEHGEIKEGPIEGNSAETDLEFYSPRQDASDHESELESRRSSIVHDDDVESEQKSTFSQQSFHSAKDNESQINNFFSCENVPLAQEEDEDQMEIEIEYHDDGNNLREFATAGDETFNMEGFYGPSNVRIDIDEN